MSIPRMSEEYAAAFREALVDHVGRAATPRRQRRALLGTTIALTLVLGGAATAAATGLLALPGSTESTPLGATRSGSFTGTGSLDLGARPDDATAIALSFTCLTPGSFTFDDGAAVTCTTAEDSAHPATYVLPLDAVDAESVTVTTTPGASWTLSAGYIAARVTDWAVNESGQTYGVLNERGAPDLISVIATNGREGYVHRADLENADGTTAAQSFDSPEDALRWQEQNAGVVHRIPVYESDGTTRIGEFEIHSR